MSSATLENFADTPTDTCPHGVETGGELSCYLCYNEAQTGNMALTDPRREQ